MNMDYLGVFFFGAWIITGIFIIPVTIALEILISTIGNQAWMRIIPVVIGTAMACPAAMLWAAASIAGISGEWWTLGGALLLSLICSAIGWCIQRKMK